MISLLTFACLRSSNSASIEQVECEKIGLLYNYGPKTCYMQEATIDSPGHLIKHQKDLTIKNLEFYFNRKIRFLPIKVHEKLPNLMMISANYCSIKKIAKENFEKLNKLERLYLSGNQLEEIQPNCFEDSTQLEYLHLSMTTKLFRTFY